MGVLTGRDVLVTGANYRAGRRRWADPIARFWSLVRKSDGCWEWVGPVGEGKYPRFTYNRRRQSAHRVAWQITNGPIPAGLLACHHCDNKLCVRPDHLFLGTYVDNMQDWTQKGKNRLVTDPALRQKGDNHWMRRKPEAGKRAAAVISAQRKAEWASGRRIAIRDEKGRIMGTQMDRSA